MNGPQSGSIPAPRRADAERNRRLVLDAARRAMAESGLESWSMDAIARRAGVGKGTVYRAFGSRSGLAEALLDDAERRLQHEILSGDPPLGPGGSASERLRAFVDAYADFLEGNVDLLIEVDASPGAWLGTGAYGVWHLHVRRLLTEAGTADGSRLGHFLLAAMSPALYRHLREREGMAAAEIKLSLEELVERLTRED